MDKLKDLLNRLNKLGIPLPMLRDPKTGISSVSLTMLFLSFNVVLFGLIGKLSKLLGDIDLQQSIYLFIVCAGLYFGRKLTGNGKTITIEDDSVK